MVFTDLPAAMAAGRLKRIEKVVKTTFRVFARVCMQPIDR